MPNPYLKTWGYTDKTCFCGVDSPKNQYVQMSDRSFTGAMCPEHLKSLIERVSNDNEKIANAKRVGNGTGSKHVASVSHQKDAADGGNRKSTAVRPRRSHQVTQDQPDRKNRASEISG